MSEANCIVILAHHQPDVQAGDVVDVILFDGLI
jgi:molybdopterin molybdotransferase